MKDAELVKLFSLPGEGCYSCADRRKYIDNRLVANNGHYRFTLLPNIPNTKYTIGSTFISREDQGDEFIFCTMGEVAPSHIQIICGDDDDSSYYVKDLGSVNGTYVNDVKLGGEVKKLGFGDVLSLGPPQLEEPWARGICDCARPVFIFQENQMNRPVEAIETETSSCDYNPCDNYLILQKIMSFMPLPDLKNCRLVSHYWCDEATPFLMKRSQVHFSGEGSCDDADVNFRSTRFLSYFHNQDQLRLPNWKLEIPSDVPNPYEDTPYWTKFLSDVDTSLENREHEVQQLNLTCLSFDDSDYHAFPCFSKILESIATPTLVHLKLGISLHASDNIPPVLPPAIVFPGLKKLSLTIYGMEDEPQTKTQRFNPWIRHILKRCEALEELSLGENKFLIQPCLEHFLEQSSTPLKGLSVKYSTQLMELLLQLPAQSLKNLHLDWGYDFIKTESIPEAIHGLEKFLKKHDHSLEKLRIDLPSKAGPNLTFPALMKLKDLTVAYNYKHVKNVNVKPRQGSRRRRMHYEEEESSVSVVPVGINGPLVYQETFPALQSLRVLPQFWIRCVDERDSPAIHEEAEEHEHVDLIWDNSCHALDAFFPPGEIVKSVVRLDVPLKLTKQVNEYGETPLGKTTFYKGLKGITEMFPNVHNPLLELVRKEEWTGDEVEEEMTCQEELKNREIGRNMKSREERLTIRRRRYSSD